MLISALQQFCLKLETGFGSFCQYELFALQSHSCTEKIKIDMREILFLFIYIYNKQIIAQKVLCRDFYSLVAKLWKTHLFASLTCLFNIP